MPCTHTISEMDVASNADGLCPLCLLGKIQELRSELASSVRETAECADLIAFWAYQAKWYFAKTNKLGDYDDLPPARQRAIDTTFEAARIAENRERHSHAEAPRDIGGT